MCGIIGIVSKDCIKNELYIGLKMLQHRGQDAFGICTTSNYTHKGFGLVEAPLPSQLDFQKKLFPQNLGIGHVRYPTNGSKTDPNLIQPFFSEKGNNKHIFAFNGNIHNVPKEYKSDTDWLFHLLTRTDNIAFNIECVYRLCQGSFSCLLISNKILYAFRDAQGIRPLCVGQYKNNYAFVSESVAINAIGYKLIRDVKPGECISVHGRFLQTMQYRKPNYNPCLFEYIYLARQDSIIDGILVYKARQIMGRLLAEKIRYNNKIDMIIPVPDTSRIAAIEMSRVLHIPYVEALVKNRYISRTFIQPTQLDRINAVTMKFNVIESLVKDKNVLIVDDSIVRGTTIKRIIQLVKRCGAKSICIASCAPPVININQYGIDIPSQEELIAHNFSKNIELELDVQHVYWQDLDKLTKALSTDIVKQFESGCFTDRGSSPIQPRSGFWAKPKSA